ncbi:helix-turn-helix domain-containing protein [Nostoc sp. WHI]|uniref:helix-turn-helix domain-containing protein n=1 Tax=Nostoc sp. WHI TaxID=2650611 RepID=UPI003FA60697
MIDPLVSIKDVMRTAAISHSELYREFDRGRLKKIKRGRRTYVLASELQRYIQTLVNV